MIRPPIWRLTTQGIRTIREEEEQMLFRCFKDPAASIQTIDPHPWMKAQGIEIFFPKKSAGFHTGDETSLLILDEEGKIFSMLSAPIFLSGTKEKQGTRCVSMDDVLDFFRVEKLQVLAQCQDCGDPFPDVYLLQYQQDWMKKMQGNDPYSR